MKRPENPAGMWQFVIVVLSIYVLGALLAETALKLSPEVKRVLHIMDFAICIVFLGDFSVRFAAAPSKLRFMRWGWIDLISSIPTIDALRWGRLIRIIRILRAIRSAKVLLRYIMINRARGTVVSVSLAAFLTLTFASIAILNMEDEPNSNIKTAGDALWWACTTITTVGYGDHYPVTAQGRFIAVVLMVMGIATFGTLTAYLSRFFFEEEQKEENSELAAIRMELRELRKLIEEQRKD